MKIESIPIENTGNNTGRFLKLVKPIKKIRVLTAYRSHSLIFLLRAYHTFFFLHNAYEK